MRLELDDAGLLQCSQIKMGGASLTASLYSSHTLPAVLS